MNKKRAIDVLREEIKYHVSLKNNNQTKELPTIQYRKGFISGLRHAVRLLRAMKEREKA